MPVSQPNASPSNAAEDAASAPPAAAEWEPLFDPQAARGEEYEARRKKIEYVVVSLVVIYLAGYEWLRWWMKTPVQPIWLTVFAACIVGYCLLRIGLLRLQSRARHAARYVWERLTPEFARLGERGFYVFEGLTDWQGALLGPILVGPSGVYSLSVRTTPPTGSFFEKVHHLDADTLRLGPRRAFADPLGSARRAARRVAVYLEQRGVPGAAVTPVLIFPGWRMGQVPPGGQRDVLVVNEKTLAAEVLGRSPALEPKDLLALTEALK